MFARDENTWRCFANIERRAGKFTLWMKRTVRFVHFSFFFTFLLTYFLSLGNANYVEAKMWADFSIKSMWEVNSYIQCFRSKQSIQNYQRSSILCNVFWYSKFQSSISRCGNFCFQRDCLGLGHCTFAKL